MAKKKEDLDFEYEDEDEVAEDDEYGEEDVDEDGDEFDEEDDEDSEEGGKKGGGAVKVALFAVLFLGAVGAGAFAFMSGGGSMGFLAGLPVVGQYFAEPTPPPTALPTGFVNPNLETRKPATEPQPGAAAPSGGATGAVAANPAAPAAVPAAKPADPVAAKPAAAPPAAKPAAPPAEEPPPVIEQPEEPVAVAAKPEPRKAAAKKKPARVATKAKKQRWARRQDTWAAATDTGSGRYSVQVGAFSQPANAERLIATLKSQGYPAFGTGTGRVSYGHTGGQFHVRSNVVDSRQKANQLANQFRLAGWSPRVVPLSGSRYVLHLGTFGTQEQANNLVADLNAKGLFATVTGRVGASRVAAVPSAGGGPNRVWVGHFGSRAEAEAMASRLRSTVGAAIVVRR